MIKTLIIDSREPDGLYAHLTDKFKNIATVKAKLEVGDYLIGCDDGETLCVERKAPSDLLNSIADNRLFSQIHRAKEKYERLFLFIHGQVIAGKNGYAKYSHRGRWIDTEWKYNSVRGALISVQELGAIVISGEDIVDTFLSLSKRNRGPIRIKPQRESSPFTQTEHLMATFPGIGPGKAHEIDKYFGSTVAALRWLTDLNWTDDSIPGIGDGTKRKAKKFLGLKEDQFLDVRTINSNNS